VCTCYTSAVLLLKAKHRKSSRSEIIEIIAPCDQTKSNKKKKNKNKNKKKKKNEKIFISLKSIELKKFAAGLYSIKTVQTEN